MATIIAARLQLQNHAEEVIYQLIQAGFAPEKITSFYVNPPGQHAAYPIGGDHYQSPKLSDDDKETSVTSTTEALIGVSSHKRADSLDHTGTDGTPHTHLRQYRSAGMLVAVELSDLSAQDQTIAMLRQLGANNIEEAQGEITDGSWADFDPLSEPVYLIQL